MHAETRTQAHMENILQCGFHTSVTSMQGDLGHLGEGESTPSPCKHAAALNEKTSCVGTMKEFISV